MSRWNFPWSLGIFLSYNDHRTDHYIDKKNSGIKRISICSTTNSTFIKEGDFTLLPHARLISHKWFKKQKMAWKGRWKRTLMAYLWLRSDNPLDQESQWSTFSYLQLSHEHTFILLLCIIFSVKSNFFIKKMSFWHFKKREGVLLLILLYHCCHKTITERHPDRVRDVLHFIKETLHVELHVLCVWMDVFHV